MLYLRKLDTPRVGVLVQRTGRKDYKIVPGKDSLSVYKAGMTIKELDAEEHILSPDGEPVKAEGRFFLSCETIDPFHIAFDLF